MSDKETNLVRAWQQLRKNRGIMVLPESGWEDWQAVDEAIRVAAECRAPAPQPADLREALRKALDLIWEHHEIGFIHRAYEAGVGSCELCKDSRLLALGKVLEATDKAQ